VANLLCILKNRLEQLKHLIADKKYTIGVKNKLKNRVQNTLFRINLALEISQTCVLTQVQLICIISMQLNVLCHKGTQAKLKCISKVELKLSLYVKSLITARTGIDRAIGQ